MAEAELSGVQAAFLSPGVENTNQETSGLRQKLSLLVALWFYLILFIYGQN